MQMTPSALKPPLHGHKTPPGIFLHVESMGQLAVLSAHSFISISCKQSKRWHQGLYSTLFLKYASILPNKNSHVLPYYMKRYMCMCVSLKHYLYTNHRSWHHLRCSRPGTCTQSCPVYWSTQHGHCSRLNPWHIRLYLFDMTHEHLELWFRTIHLFSLCDTWWTF